MDIDFRRIRMCTSKAAFRTKAAAHKHLSTMQKKAVDRADLLVVYKCTYCGRFHIGHDYAKDN